MIFLHPSKRSGFALLSAVLLVVFLLGVVLLAASLVRFNSRVAQRHLLQAKTQALLGLDSALSKLSAEAAVDELATFDAALLGNRTNPNWLGAWTRGESAPEWLVSGDTPDVSAQADFELRSADRSWVVELVRTDAGAYAYAVEDGSQKAVEGGLDRLDRFCGVGDISLFGRLGHNDIDADVLAGDQRIAMNWGVLSNARSGGLKIALDANEALGDALVGEVVQWRDPNAFILGRPIIFGELALLMGVYKNADNQACLGLAFWADAWNPYTQKLPFNPRGEDDFHLRLVAPKATLKFYSSTGALSAIALLDLGAQTQAQPIGTDLYGDMQPGEIRFITHYRLLPLGVDVPSDVAEVEVSFAQGEWSFIFESFDGQLIQKIADIPYERFSRRFSYDFISLEQISWPRADWVVGWKIREPLDLSKFDPRAKQLEFDNDLFSYNADMLDAQASAASFRASDRYSDGYSQMLFDLPQGACVSVGHLRHKRLEGVAPLSLGEADASAQNSLFDRYFFSGLDVLSDECWGALPVLPNPRLRLLGAPSLAEVRSRPAAYLLIQGAFNINSLSADLWGAQLPKGSYHFEFSPLMDTPTPTAVSSLAAAVVGALRARHEPFFSLSEFADAGIVSADLFSRVAPYLSVRGDTFVVHSYGEAPRGGARIQLRAIVQRLPQLSATGRGRVFQIVAIDWLPEIP